MPDLIQGRYARRRSEREPPRFPRYLQPVDSLEKLLRSVRHLRRRRPRTPQLIHDRLHHDRLRVLESLEGPPVKPDADRLRLLGDRSLGHLEDTRLARAPIAMDANSHRCLTSVTDKSDDGLRDRFVVEEICCRLLVV